MAWYNTLNIKPKRMRKILNNYKEKVGEERYQSFLTNLKLKKKV